MKAVTWQGVEDVRVEDVPDPRIEEPTDAIVRITSTAICGSDLHLYKLMSRIWKRAMSSATSRWGSSRRSVRRSVRSLLAIGSCCRSTLRAASASCVTATSSRNVETTQVKEQGKGAALFGYTKLYGQVPGAQAEFLRVPQAQFGPIKVPEGPAGRALPLPLGRSPDCLAGGEVRGHSQGRHARDYGLGPIGQMSVRITKHLGVERVMASISFPSDRSSRALWGRGDRLRRTRAIPLRRLSSRRRVAARTP